MSKLSVAEMRQLLTVTDIFGQVGTSQEVAKKRGFSFEVDKDYAMCATIHLGPYTQQILKMTTNDAKVLFLEMGREFGVDVLALLDALEAR